MRDLPWCRCGLQHVKWKTLADVSKSVVCCQRHVGRRLKDCHVAGPNAGIEIIRKGGSNLHWPRDVYRISQIHCPPLSIVAVGWERSTRGLVALINGPVGKTRRKIISPVVDRIYASKDTHPVPLARL